MDCCSEEWAGGLATAMDGARVAALAGAGEVEAASEALEAAVPGVEEPAEAGKQYASNKKSIATGAGDFHHAFA